MMLLTVLVMLTARLGEAYPTVPFRYTLYNEDEGPEQAVLKVLRELEPAPPTGPPHPLLDALLSQEMGVGLTRKLWWHKAKKRENLSSYNWNSFGLRYGK